MKTSPTDRYLHGQAQRFLRRFFSRDRTIPTVTSTPSEDGDKPAEAESLSELLQRDPKAFLEEADALIAKGRLDEILRSIDEALASNPRDIEILKVARYISRNQLGLEEAAKYALLLSELQPNDPKNEVLLADWYLASGQADMALRLMEALLRECPSADRAIIQKGRALIALERAPEALQLVGQAVEREIGDVKLLSFARNVALEYGTLAAARDYALLVEATSPHDQKNRATLIQCDLTLGHFDAALARADALIADHPYELSASMLRAQALIALHRVTEGFRVLQDALEHHGDEPRLLALLRTVALNNGFFAEAVDYAVRASAGGSGGVYDKVLLVHSYLAAGEYDEAEAVVGPRLDPPAEGPLRKEHHHFWEFRQLQESAPLFVRAWELALANRAQPGPSAALKASSGGATMIQYWSQGAPPSDVQIVCDNWKSLFGREKLGEIEVYDRASAEAWIRENAPEFAAQFAQSFHYAMESDIFRVAYASKRPCIYMDIDSWPLEHTASILRFAVESNSTMLYVRSSRAGIVNGFFVSTPESPFTRELVKQCLAIDLAPLPKTYQTLESSFGPSRYTRVLLDLLSSSSESSAASAQEVPGCSFLSLGHSRIYLAHEAAVAGVRPPFPLGYKATDDYWKFFSLQG